jgi:hypothetical protein
MSDWYMNPITHPYLPNYESDIPDSPHFAEDIGTPWHTQITALLPGTVEKADFQAWGGELFIKPDDSSFPEYYYYHLDDLAAGIAPGTHVGAGQFVGLSGGQTSGGDHPVTDGESTGPHTHVGWFDRYVTPPETGFTIPHGPDITPFMDNVRSKGIGNGGASPPPVQTTTTSLNPLDSIGAAIVQFENWLTNSIGGFLMRVAVGGVGIGLIFLGSREVVDAMKNIPNSYQKARGTSQRAKGKKAEKKPIEKVKPKEEKQEVHTRSKEQAAKAAKSEKKVETAEKVAEVAAA